MNWKWERGKEKKFVFRPYQNDSGVKMAMGKIFQNRPCTLPEHTASSVLGVTSFGTTLPCPTHLI